jgi:hypothetical protein
MPLTSAREQIGIGRQSAIGSLVAITDLQTVSPDAGSFSASETVEQILDQGRRGAEAMDYQAFSGIKSTEISFDFPMMYGTSTSASGNTGSILGILLRNLLGSSPGTGATDTLQQGRLGSTNVHNNYFRLGTSKQYLTVGRRLMAHADAGTDKDTRFGAARCNEITISANAGEGFVTCSASLTAKSETETDMSSLTNGNFKTATVSDNMAMGWQNLQVATYPQKIVGTTVTNIISWDVTFSRDITPIYTSGNTQDYSDIYLGPLEVTFTVVCDIPSNVQLAAWRAGTTGITQFAVSSGHASVNNEASRALVIGMANSTITEGPLEIDTSASYSTVSLSGRGLANKVGVVMQPSGNAFTTATNLNHVSPVEVLIKEVGEGANAPVY